MTIYIRFIFQNGPCLVQGTHLLSKNTISGGFHATKKVKQAIGCAVFHELYTGEVEESSTTKRRYYLARTWDEILPNLCVFMMNPSTADEIFLDNTVEFMINYAIHNGYGSLSVVNTSPIIKSSDTTAQDFVYDQANFRYIESACKKADTIILGWGKNGQVWGIPILLQYPLFIELMRANKEKLHVFTYRNNNNLIYPAHPHPQRVDQRFPLSHPLKKVSERRFRELFI